MGFEWGGRCKDMGKVFVVCVCGGYEGGSKQTGEEAV